MKVFLGEIPVKRIYHKSVIVYGLETEIVRAVEDILPILNMNDEASVYVDMPTKSLVEDVLPGLNINDEVRITLEDVEVWLKKS